MSESQANHEMQSEANVENSISETHEVTQNVDNNVEFHRLRANILTDVLTKEDKKLIANLIDQSERVILHEQDLKKLIAAMKNTTEDNIKFDVQETIIATCTKHRVLPFKKITGFSGFTQEDKDLLESKYHISVGTIYDEPFVSV